MLRSFAARSRRARWAVTVAALLALPSLSVGWFYDDVVHRAVLDHAVAGYESSPLALYEFLDGPETVARLRADGRLPWFTDSDVAIRFFRPLPSALRALEHEALGDRAWAAHLIGALLFVAWVLIVFDLLEIIDRDRAPLGALVFACAGAHGLSVGWVAARYVLLVGIFSTLALRAYLRAAEVDAPPSRAVFAAVWLALALGCGESALATVLFIGAHLALAPRSEPHRRVRRARLRAAWPAFLTAALFLVLYGAAGYGARGTALYLSPWQAPAAYLGALPERLAVLVADLTTNLPSGVLYLQPPLRPYGWIVGVAGAALVVVAVALTTSATDRRRLGWLWLGAGLSLFLAAAAIPEGRVLGLAGVAIAATLAAVLQNAWRMRRSDAALGEPRGAARPLAMGVALLLAFFALVIGPLVCVALTAGQAGLSRWHELIVVPSPSAEGTAAHPSYAFLLDQDDVLLWFYTPVTMPADRRLVPLGVVPGAVTFERIDERTLELRAESSAGMLDSPLAGLVRARPLAPGERVEAGELTAEVLDAAPSLRVRFTFRESLDSPRYRFLEWDGASLVPVTLDTGVPRRVSAHPGPSASPPP